MERAARYTLLHQTGHARRGRLHLTHGTVETPAFMPVGTQGTVKSLAPDDIRATGSEIVLANTWHLWVRPGHERVARLGGLHKMMAWDRPILTDSGGFQVFSLADTRKVKEEGVRFRSPVDGQWRELTPEKAIEIQEALGVDIAMALDECVGAGAPEKAVRAAMDRTTRWLKRCDAARQHRDTTALFGIVQGGLDLELRQRHLDAITPLDLDGYALGGLSVGEGREELYRVTRAAAPMMPADRPRYLMGVGYPLDLIEGVMAGIDMFDCVIPTRTARFGTLFTSQGKMAIKHARYQDDPLPPDPSCPCYTCQNFSRAYLRHLFMCEEALMPRLMTLHNVTYYQRLMKQARDAIEAGPDALAAVRAAAARAMEPLPDGA